MLKSVSYTKYICSNLHSISPQLLLFVMVFFTCRRRNFLLHNFLKSFCAFSFYVSVLVLCERKLFR